MSRPEFSAVNVRLSVKVTISQNLFELIQHGNIQFYPDDPLRSHAIHCVAVESSRDWKI